MMLCSLFLMSLGSLAWDIWLGCSFLWCTLKLSLNIAFCSSFIVHHLCKIYSKRGFMQGLAFNLRKERKLTFINHYMYFLIVLVSLSAKSWSAHTFEHEDKTFFMERSLFSGKWHSHLNCLSLTEVIMVHSASKRIGLCRSQHNMTWQISLTFAKLKVVYPFSDGIELSGLSRTKHMELFIFGNSKYSKSYKSYKLDLILISVSIPA